MVQCATRSLYAVSCANSQYEKQVSYQIIFPLCCFVLNSNEQNYVWRHHIESSLLRRARSWGHWQVCAVSLCVLKLLRHHGMNDGWLRHVYKAVVLSKLLYASSAWWEFTCATDRQRLEASIRRAVRSGFYASDEPSMSQLVEDSDDNVWQYLVQSSPRST